MPYWSTLYLASEWAIRFVMLVYVPQQRPAAAARTWLLLIFLLPWPGLVLYALFGRIRVPRARIEQQMLASQRIVQAQLQQKPYFVCEPELPSYLAHIPGLAARLGDFGPFAGNAVELLPDYASSIARLVADIDSASHHVHLLTYIFAADATGERVASALASAARRGVQCRVMADAVGSRAGLHRWGAELRRDGVEVIAMLQAGFFRHNAARFDLRNHRKLVVIDGRIGYAGSQNIIDPEFVPGHPNEELVARVTGPVVAQIQAVLLADRFIETGDTFDFAPLFPELPAAGSSAAQLLPSGPGYQRENAEELFIALLYAARQRVVITTPYFVPDEPFLSALRTAARRGVEVRLIVSLHANQRFTQLAQRSYYDDVLAAGVHVHLYRPRFLHAKHLSVDDSIALLGSTNIDIRSFALNAEASFIVYDSAVTAKLRALQEAYLAESDLLDLASWRQRPFTQRVVQNLARLADSLL
jgi:cardiolipin synthase A/B